MTASLREQRKTRTSAGIAAAALELFAVRGYADVTVGEVAAAAGVAERTLYRYFADKDDLLFAEDEQMRAALEVAIERQPDVLPPLSVLHAVSLDLARTLQDRREHVVRRAQIVAGSPALTARDRAKKVAWEGVLTDGLERRGVPRAQASLMGRVGVACQDEALSRWLERDPPPRTLAVELDVTFRHLADLVSSRGAAPLARPVGGAAVATSTTGADEAGDRKARAKQ